MMEEQGQERTRRSTELLGQDALQELAAMKVELRSEHEKNSRAYFQFMRKDHQRRKPDLARRSAIIQGIPCLWAIAVSFLLPLESAAQEEEEVQKQEQEDGGDEGAGWVLMDPVGSVVLGNWQAPKAQLSRVQAGPHP